MLTPLSQVSATSPTAVPEPRLVRAAHEFEAQLMKELLKPLTSRDGDESGSAGALGDYAGEALGLALSDHGGLGIAGRILSQVSHSGNRTASAPVTTHVPANTGLGTDK